MAAGPSLKPVIWVGSSRNDLRAFPGPVRERMGYALYVAQSGGKHRDTKTLSGFGGGCAGAVFVLHAFQKKSKTGRETSHRDIELVRQRLRQAEEIAKGREP